MARSIKLNQSATIIFFARTSGETKTQQGQVTFNLPSGQSWGLVFREKGL